MTGSVRHDDHSEFGGETSARLAFAWRATDALTLRGAAATGYRPPSIDEATWAELNKRAAEIIEKYPDAKPPHVKES